MDSFKQYIIQVLYSDGSVRRVPLRTDKRLPVAGEWVDVEGEWCEVHLGMHPRRPGADDDIRDLLLYAVPVPVGTTPPGTTGPKIGNVSPFPRGGFPSGSGGHSAGPRLEVLPFVPPSTADCAYFPPALVLTLVVSGYQEQSILLESAKFETWRLMRSESHWFLARTSDELADELRWWSREALFQMRQAEGFILREWPMLLAASDGTQLLDLDSYRRAKAARAQNGSR
jgi:hypothetical protein